MKTTKHNITNTAEPIKPGYKKTPVGIIPEDWGVKEMGDVSKVNQGLQIPISERFLEKVENSYFYLTNEFLKKDSKKNYYIKNPPKNVICNKEDILMTRTGNTGAVVTGVEGAFHNNFFKIKYDKELLDKNYLYDFLTHPKTQFKILVLAGNSTIPDLNHSEFYKLKLPIPPLPEQKAIADCLSTWDKGIEKLSALIASKKEQKKGLMQQLLTGKKRLDGFTEEWKEVRLGDIAYITTGASNKQDAGDGFKYVFFDRSSDVLTSKIFLYDCEAIIVPGEGADFIPKYFVGKFDLHQRAYAIMDFKNVLGKYIFYYLINDRKHLHRQAVGSTVKSLRLPYFKNMPMRIPSFEEQATIAEVLTTADKEIELLENKLEFFKTQKKGLMQVLLTGALRLCSRTNGLVEN